MAEYFQSPPPIPPAGGGDGVVYQHTQQGRVMRLAFAGMAAAGLVMLLVGVGLKLWWANVPACGVTGLVLLIVGPTEILMGLIFLALFHSLTVRVGGEQVVFFFGSGLIRKTVPVADITHAEAVKNKPWWGWGIRYIGPGAWLYNVAGLDAVALSLKNGKAIRIGTDDPQGLEAAIRRVMG